MAPPNDLDKFSAGPPQRRIDDKAAELEAEIQQIKADSRRIYFVLSFISSSFFLLFVAATAQTTVISFAVIMVLIFLIGLAKWLDFPWVTENLQSQLDRFSRKPKKSIETEPSTEE